MKFVNCTGHDINVFSEHGALKRVIPRGEHKARVTIEKTPAPEIDGIEIVHRRRVGVRDLPPPQPGVRYIVSSLVALEERERKDLLVPIPFFSHGNIIGAKGFYIDQGGKK